ncbi:Cullin-3, partial [Serendipita sp. 398]
MASTQAIRKAKGKIKPPRKHGPDTSIQDTWASLSHAIKEIQNERAHQLSFEENYRYAYNLVLFRQGDFLYRNVKSLITENLSNLTEEYIIPAFATGNHEDPVTRGQEGEVLMKGDRVYTVSAEVPQIIPAGLKIFIDDVLHRTTAPVQEQVVNAILGQVQGDRTCELAISEALGSFINQNPRAPEFVSLFIDENLKKGLKGKTDDEIEQVLDKTITLFRFLTDKDTFERYYKTHLARRLLFNRSVSDDAERGMLAKLKVECGVQFTKKMEGMFNDMKLSSDVVTAYRDYLSNTTAPAVEINVTVMTSTFWPTTNSGATCTLPIQLQQACSSFERFYNTRHSGRRLTWQPALGNADVKVQFKAKRHDLNVTTMAIVILLLFENIPDDDFLTYEDIQKSTSIPDHDLQRHLQSLACGKWKILKKHPESREVSTSDS